MQISSLIDIVSGILKNEPSISFITQIQTKVIKVNDGDLFVAFNNEEIQLAIENGAFAIVYSGDVKIIDDEIAWICVDDVQLSLLRLLRFIVSSKQTKAIVCDDISLELINILSIDKKTKVFLQNDIKKDFDKLKYIDDDIVVFSNNFTYISNIFPISKQLDINNHDIKNVTIYSLFTTTFSYNEEYFYKLKLPYIFIDKFLTVKKFLKDDFDINSIKKLKYLKPLFIDSNCNIVEFGKSNRFLLGNDNVSLIDEEIKFLKSHYKYVKIDILEYDLDSLELFESIKQSKANVIYVKYITLKKLENMLIKNFRKDSSLL